MDKRLLSSDDGFHTYLIYDDATDTAALHYEQDTKHIIERAAYLREQTPWVNKDKWAGRWASIPFFVITELKARGIDVWNKDHWPKVASVIEADYPHLKTSNYNLGKVKR